MAVPVTPGSCSLIKATEGQERPLEVADTPARRGLLVEGSTHLTAALLQACFHLVVHGQGLAAAG